MMAKAAAEDLLLVCLACADKASDKAGEDSATGHPCSALSV